MDNITFTTEQKEQLKTNVRAIERYIEENVVPYITGDVRLKFGDIYHCPRTGTPTAMYTLCVSPEKKSRYAGWNVYKNAYVGLECKFGPAFILEERLPYDQYALLKNWQSLKQQLEQVIDKQRTDAALSQTSKYKEANNDL